MPKKPSSSHAERSSDTSSTSARTWFLAGCIAASSLAAGPANAQLRPRPRYTLRPGDVITLDYRYTPEFNQTATLQPDGFIDLTLIGQAHAAGLTLAQLHTLVADRAALKLKDPEVNVTLKQFEHPYLAVAGEVANPGRFDFYDPTTALQAVLLAGGFKPSAQQSSVYVFRRIDGGLAEVHHLNLKALRTGHDLERDLILEPGDMILVPRNKLDILGRFLSVTRLAVYFDPLTFVAH